MEISRKGFFSACCAFLGTGYVWDAKDNHKGYGPRQRYERLIGTASPGFGDSIVHPGARTLRETFRIELDKSALSATIEIRPAFWDDRFNNTGTLVSSMRQCADMIEKWGAA